jgi:hypothetical protein
MQIQNALITGSFSYNGADLSNITSSNAYSASLSIRTTDLESTSSVLVGASSSFSSILTSVSSSQQQISASLLALTASYNALSASYTALSASYNTASSSFSTRITSDSSSMSSRTTQVEKTYASTGSNTFTGPQNFSNTCTPNSFTAGASIYTAGGLQVTQDSYFSSSVFIKGNVTVFGTQSVSYISSSQLDIGTNIITVNTSTPSVRYGGLSVFDSGSTGLTGSIFWDSELNRWIYVNASGSGGGATYGGGMFISGPRNSVGLGCEQGTTACMLLVGQGGDHLTSSMIYHSSTVTCIPNTLIGSNICATMANASCIGIGTTTPTHPLEIYAATGNQLKISTNDATSANNSGIFLYNEASATSSTRRSYILLDPNGANGSGGDYSYFDMYGSGTARLINQLTSGLLALGVGGTNIINITGSSVGIGTSSPGAKLEVAGVDENILKLKNTSGQPALIRFNDTSTTGDPYIGSYGNSLAFGIYGVGESIRINSSRNVGIRTDAPFSLLHVGTRPGAGTTNPSLGSIATVSNDGLTGIDLGGNVNANNVVGHINWVNYLGVGNYNTARIDVYANGAGNSGDLRFWTATVASSPTIRLTIASTGAATFSSSVTAASATVVNNTAGAIAAIGVYNANNTNGSGGGYEFYYNSGIRTGGVYNKTTGTGAGYYLSFENFNGSSAFEAMRINGSGNVGIGTSSPAALLHVQAANNVTGKIIVKGGKEAVLSVGEINSQLDFGSNDTSVGNDNNIAGRIASVTEYDNGAFVGMAFYTYQQGRSPDLKEALRIANTGNVGIGTETPGEKLTVQGPANNWTANFIGSTTSGQSLGLLVTAGTTTADHAMIVQSSSNITLLRIAGNGVACFAYTVCAPCFATISDYRMKSNIRPIAGLSIIMNTKPYKFEYNYDCSTSFGMIAHELQDALPEAVFGQKDGETMQGVDYMKLLPITIKAIQEQQCTICSQATMINVLKTCLGIA